MNVRKTVLIVDDDPGILYVLANGLSNALDMFDVVTAGNGREAVEVLEARSVDVIVTDLAMPVMDGFALIGYVTSQRASLPVVVLSGMAPAHTDERLAGYGGLRVLRKPAAYRDVAQCVLEEIERVERGRVEGIPLAGVMQLVESERRSCTVIVNSGKRRGRLQFESGRLVNAFSEDFGAEGEAAAYDILSWDDTAIEFAHLPTEVRRLIHTSMQSMLIELAARQDEALLRGGGAPATDTDDAAGPPTRTPAPSPAPARPVAGPASRISWAIVPPTRVPTTETNAPATPLGADTAAPADTVVAMGGGVGASADGEDTDARAGRGADPTEGDDMDARADGDTGPTDGVDMGVPTGDGPEPTDQAGAEADAGWGTGRTAGDDARPGAGRLAEPTDGYDAHDGASSASPDGDRAAEPEAEHAAPPDAEHSDRDDPEPSARDDPEPSARLGSEPTAGQDGEQTAGREEGPSDAAEAEKGQPTLAPLWASPESLSAPPAEPDDGPATDRASAPASSTTPPAPARGPTAPLGTTHDGAVPAPAPPAGPLTEPALADRRPTPNGSVDGSHLTEMVAAVERLAQRARAADEALAAVATEIDAFRAAQRRFDEVNAQREQRRQELETFREDVARLAREILGHAEGLFESMAPDPSRPPVGPPVA